MRDHRMRLNLFIDVLDVLERHGFARSDDQHTGRAIFLIGDLARTYEGVRETQPDPVVPSPHPGPAPPVAEADQAAVVLTPADALTVFAAMDIAADDKRYRIEMCPDCPDQSCPACQTHLRDAEAFDQMADRMLRAAQAAPAATASKPGPDRRSQPAADREAGQ